MANCGIVAQRDLYTAFLAQFVENDVLDTSQAQHAWPGAGVLLEQAVSRLSEVAIGKRNLSSFGLNQRQSCLSAKKRSVLNNALDVVKSI